MSDLIPRADVIGLLSSASGTTQKTMDAIRAIPAAQVAAWQDAAAKIASHRWAIHMDHSAKLFEMDYPDANIDAMIWGARADEADAIANEIRAITAAPIDPAQIRADALREAVRWHIRQAEAAMGALSCGSENRDMRVAGRLNDWHRDAAAAIASLIDASPSTDLAKRSANGGGK